MDQSAEYQAISLGRRRFLIGIVAVSIGLTLAEGYYWVDYVLTADQRPQILGETALSQSESVIEILSPRYELDEVRMSMEGPNSNHPLIPVSMNSKDEHRDLWITGVKTELIDPELDETISPEFFCHSNLTLSPYDTAPEDHNQLFDSARHLEWRLFTLVPGRMEITLPEGFGIPVKMGTKIDYFTMALNQNPGLPARSLKMKTQILTNKSPLKSLFRRSLYVYQKHLDQQDVSIASMPELLKVAQHQGELCAQSCDEALLGQLPSLFQSMNIDHVGSWHPGSTCCVENASEGGVIEQFGVDHTVHWMVSPGKHRYRSEVTEQLKLPFDTTAHYVTGHLHPMGTRLQLIDMESQETVFEITAECREERLGVLTMSELKSQAGTKIEQGKRYELIADYDNPTDKPIDAMGIMYVYLLDEDVPTKSSDAEALVVVD